ncbi:MAG: hypothetical protein KAJ07_04700 [Planctomycetes bacterium]|nr:hypothetical protein [Planctomycetota bacterium]
MDNLRLRLIKIKIAFKEFLYEAGFIPWPYWFCADCDKQIKGGFPRERGHICADCAIKESNIPRLHKRKYVDMDKMDIEVFNE